MDRSGEQARFWRWLPAAVGLPLLLMLLALNPFPPTVEAPATFVPAPVQPSPALVAAATATTVPVTATTAPSPTAGQTAVAALPSPTVVPTATPLPVAGVPVRIVIPRLKIDADVEHVGLAPDGAMDVPQRFDTVGWYKLGARPGELGNAVLAGHLDSKTGPAIFWRLKELQPGDEVIVAADDGKERRFVVRELENYIYDQAPLERIFGQTESVGLNLITCIGTFDRRSQNYDQRLVVYTTLVG